MMTPCFLLIKVCLQVILCRPVVVSTAPGPRRGPRTALTGGHATHAATWSVSRGQERCAGASLEGEGHSSLYKFCLVVGGSAKYRLYLRVLSEVHRI